MPSNVFSILLAGVQAIFEGDSASTFFDLLIFSEGIGKKMVVFLDIVSRKFQYKRDQFQIRHTNIALDCCVSCPYLFAELCIVNEITISETKVIFVCFDVDVRVACNEITYSRVFCFKESCKKVIFINVRNSPTPPEFL